jgi:hypothetical protein
MKNRILQAYKQTPWRIQLQWICIFLLAVVVIASITGIYLNINAQAAGAGRNIQGLEYDIDEINNKIADLTTELAAAKSTANMLNAAEEMGFQLMNPVDAVYLEIPGYNPNQDFVLAPSRTNVIAESPTLRSSYTLSLWEWFAEKLWRIPADEPTLEGEQ